MKKRALSIVAACIAGGVLLAGCGTVTEDRSNSAGGKNPDHTADARNVTLYRNADGIPNVATFCLGRLGFAATLSTDGTRSPSLTRVSELDDSCAG